MPGTPFLGVKAVPWRSLGLAFALFDPFFLTSTMVLGCEKTAFSWRGRYEHIDQQE